MEGARSRLKRRRFIFWQSFFFIFTVLLAVYILFQSPVFLVDQIEVRGHHRLPAAEVARASGLVTGINIFKADLKAAREMVMTMPMVEAVETHRQYPGTIIITVKERVAVAMVVTEDGFVELDGGGIYLRQGKAGTAGLPVITGIPVKSAGPGRPVEGHRLDTALEVVEKLPRDLCNILSEVHVAGDGRITLYTLAGVECRLGVPEDLESKGSYILQVLDTLNDHNAGGIEYVDFSIVSTPVVKYKP